MNTLLNQIWTGFLQILNAPLLKLGEATISIASIFQLIFSLLVIVFIIRWLKVLLARKLLIRLKIDANNREAIATIISYGTGILGLILLLQYTGFNLASLAVLAGGLGVGIGLGLQDLTINFISGMTLLLNRKLRVGDFIEFENLSGYIEEVSLQSTVIRTLDGGNVVVPNRHLTESRVVNWSYDSYAARIHIPVGIAYGSDLAVATEAILSCAYTDASVVYDPAPKVLFSGFGSSSIDLVLRVWVKRIDLQPDIRSALYYAIEDSLRQHGIQIPFPQADLWLRNPEMLHIVVQPAQSHEAPSYTHQELPSREAPTKQRTLKALLQQVTYFQNLTDVQLRQLIEVGHRQRLQESEILFREGDPGNAFYIILAGAVEVLIEKINKQLTVLSAGQFFGELSLMLGIPRTATVCALEPTVLFVINHKAFEVLLADHPEFYEGIVKELNKHQGELAERQKQLREMGLIDATEDDNNLMVWVQKRLKRLFSL
jgi:small-conductance mechanosensitive channel